MNAWTFLALALAGSACGAPAVTAVTLPPAPLPEIATSEAADPALAQRLVERVGEAERTYEMQRDPHAILDLITLDARIEAGRAEEPGPHDWRFTHKRLEAIYTWAAKYATETSFEYTNVRVIENTPFRVVFTWLTTSETNGGKTSFGHRYELERRRDWKVTAFRYWPMRPETGTEYGADYFAERDRAIDAALASGDQRQAAYQMMIGYRFDECAKLARQLADQNPTDWWSWDMRSRASAMVGDLDDAIFAGDKAAALKK